MPTCLSLPSQHCSTVPPRLYRHLCHHVLLPYKHCHHHHPLYLLLDLHSNHNHNRSSNHNHNRSSSLNHANSSPMSHSVIPRPCAMSPVTPHYHFSFTIVTTIPHLTIITSVLTVLTVVIAIIITTMTTSIGIAQFHHHRPRRRHHHLPLRTFIR